MEAAVPGVIPEHWPSREPLRPNIESRPILSSVEEALSGGNTHETIVRVGSTVRRPTGPWTPGVHALLSHLEHAGYTGAPRVQGVDRQGREVLDYIDGEVVHPHHRYLIEPDEALTRIAITIRRFHDAITGFVGGERFGWSDRGADPSGVAEILCHNDLAPWNLIHSTDDRWVFIDWDIAAPGRRSWDLSFALLSLVPLMPNDAPVTDGSRSVLQSSPRPTASTICLPTFSGWRLSVVNAKQN